MRRRILATALLGLLLATGAGAGPHQDEDARLGRLGPAEGAQAPAARGDLCGTCPDPAAAVFEIEFVGSELWELASHGTLYRTHDCGVLETIAIQGFRGLASGLAYDSQRGVLVVADLLLDQVLQVDLAGNVVGTLPAPIGDMIGAAYDSKRDLYWFPDFQADSLVSLDPDTGARGPRFPLPNSSRSAGASYAPSLDAILCSDRNRFGVFFFSAANGEVLASVPIPGEGEGVGLAPDGGIWTHLFGTGSVVCIANLDAVTPVRASTWGRIKSIYR